MFVKEECWLFGLHFEPMCHEPHTFGIHISQETSFTYTWTQITHTHASHVHTHNTLYAHVYTCTHYWRKGHIAKFCFDRINDSNFTNKFIWIRKGANLHGPNRVWVPKFTPIVFDVGVGSRLTWGYWCLDGGCVPSYMVALLDASLSREVWCEDHLGLET